MSAAELLLALSPGLPAALAALWPFDRLRKGLAALAPWAALPALALALLPGASGASLTVPTLLTGLHLELDPVAKAFLLLTAGLWVVAGVFARVYHADDPDKERFFGFFVLTMTGNLGLVLAGDLLSFYVFFTCMTFAAYGLVVHRRDPEAFRAGRVYIVLAVVAELFVLAALLGLAMSFGGIPRFGSEMETAWAGLHGVGNAELTALLLVVGFGVKAGLAPLHLWLPLAHPVAPSAASALLSGAMIKAGLFGWLRYLPAELALSGPGTVLMAFGVASAFFGIVVGLAQDDPKTVLAYSSISQMGYMALGVALVIRSPDPAPLALLAVVAYALHHGTAKGALFLAVGVADRTSQGSDGAGARFVLAAASIPALALAGAPLSSGAGAKGVLKRALSEEAPEAYTLLDPLLLLAALGTTLLMARFLATLRGRMTRRQDQDQDRSGSEPSFRRDQDQERDHERDRVGVGAPWGLSAPWLLLVGTGMVGVLWLPLIAPRPAGVTWPGLAEGAGEAAWPVAVGALVAWLCWSRPHLLGAMSTLRIPAGDLVVPVERLARRLASLPYDRLVRWDADAATAARRVQLWSHERAGWAAERDLFLARGAVVGLIFMALAGALGLILTLG